MSGRVLVFSFPNPFDLLGALVSPLLNLGEAVAGSIVADVIEGLAAAVVGALVDLAAGIMGFFWDAAEPQLQSSWFHGSPDASYDQMVLLAAPLLAVFVLAGIVQGALKGDTGGMLRMTALRLPGAVLAMSVTVAVGDLLLAVTDDMSGVLLTGFQDDITQVGVLLSRVGLAAAGSAPAMVLELVFAAVGLLAAVAVVVELFVRAALVYLVAAFSPLVYAASVWEPLRGSVRKLAELALALILSKLAIALALAVSAAALVGTLPDPGTPTALPTPEQAAAQADQPVAQTIGILVSAVVMFCVAAFMPFVLWRLLPLAEGATVAHGVRGAPLRGALMASSMATTATNNPATALLRSKRQGAGGAAGGAAATAANPAVGAARAGASAASKGAKAAKGGTRAGAQTSGQPRGGQSNGSGRGSGQGRGSSGRSRRSGGAPGGGGGSGRSQSARPTGGPRGDGRPAPTRDRPAQRSQRSQPSPRPGRGPGSNGPERNGGDRR